MLLVDRIDELEEDRIVGIKNVTVNEPFFVGHFPDFPVMPGVLIVEAMAQVAGVLVLSQIPDRHNKLVLLARMHGTATVDGAVVAEAEVMCKLADKPTDQAPAPAPTLQEV